MGDRWLIRLPADTQNRVAWTSPGDGTRVCRRDLLPDVALLAKKRIAVVVPGADVLLTWVLPPRAAKRDLTKAIPFLLEDALSAPVESLHFALGTRRADGWLPVAVVARRLMEEWLETVRTAGVEPETLLVEPLLLPWEPEQWSVVISDNMATTRTGPALGFSVDLDNLPMALQLALNDARNTQPKHIRLLVYGQNVKKPDLTPLGLPLNWEEMNGDPLSLMSGHDQPNQGINLLQGPFAPVGRWNHTLKAFRLTGALLLLWLLIKAGILLVEANRLEQRIAWLDQRILTVFRESFPEVHRIVNPKVQMSQQLAALRGPTGGSGGEEKGFLFLLGRVGLALKTLPEAVLHGVRYQENRLELLLHLPNLQRLDGLKQQLETAGLTVAIQSANREGDNIAARLKVESP